MPEGSNDCTKTVRAGQFQYFQFLLSISTYCRDMGGCVRQPTGALELSMYGSEPRGENIWGDISTSCREVQAIDPTGNLSFMSLRAGLPPTLNFPA